jgi:methylphosphotriester-DNA--protein-cysteine methyltransferase
MGHGAFVARRAPKILAVGNNSNCAQEPDSQPGRESATMVSMSSKAQPASGANSIQSAVIDPEAAWQQILSRDPVRNVFLRGHHHRRFCRPGCSSRRPLKANVRFFRSAEAARAAGFRPCKRCKPDARGNPLDEIRAHLEANLDRTVPLAELGRLVHLSPFTVQRLFKQKLGVSPLQYQRALRAWARCAPRSKKEAT